MKRPRKMDPAVSSAAAEWYERDALRLEQKLKRPAMHRQHRRDIEQRIERAKAIAARLRADQEPAAEQPPAEPHVDDRTLERALYQADRGSDVSVRVRKAGA